MQLKMRQSISLNDGYIYFFLNLDILIARSKKALKIGSKYLLSLKFTYNIIERRYLENNEEIQEFKEKIHEAKE